MGGYVLSTSCSPCVTAGQCDDGDACNGIETCESGVCTAGTPPVCDDLDPCTTDSCDAQSGCTTTPLPDGDGDGVCDAEDNCPNVANPGQGSVPFGRTLLADDPASFSWSPAIDTFWMKGDLGQVALYDVVATGVASAAVSLTAGADPPAGAGFYYLARPDCPAGSWTSEGAGECAAPATCPPGGRDGNLP